MAEWLRWYYLIYLLPAIAAVVLFLLSGMDASDADGEPSDASDVDEASEESSPHSLRHVPGFFGFGRAPVSVVLGSLMVGWGLFGFGATEVLRPLLGRPAAFAPLALGVAAIGSVLSTRLLVGALARLMPRSTTASIRQSDLPGLVGKVAFPVSESLGRVHVRDRFGTLHTRAARVASGSTRLDRGTEIIVVSIDPQGRYLVVEPLGFSTRES